MGSISTYPGYGVTTISGSTIPSTTRLPTPTGARTPFDSLPDATLMTFSATPTATGYPLANGTRTDCLEYTDNNFGNVDCLYIAGGVPLDSFVSWNPSLSYYRCLLANATRYCTLLGDGYSLLPSNKTDYADVPPNAAVNSTHKCYAWYTVQEGMETLIFQKRIPI